jgi:hypothetical protein
MDKIFITEKADKKCSGCNYAVTQFYGIGDTLENAKKDFKDTADEEYGTGLCGYCMVDLLVDEGYLITKDESKDKSNYLKVLVTDDLKSCFRKYELDSLTENDIDIITSIVIAKFSLEDNRDEVKNIIKTYYDSLNNQNED